VILDWMTAPAAIDAQSSIGPSTSLWRGGRVALIDRCMRRPLCDRAGRDEGRSEAVAHSRQLGLLDV
jgi:hypothetical protein